MDRFGVDVAYNSLVEHSQELPSVFSECDANESYLTAIDDMNSKRAEVQEKTFVKWINSKLRHTNYYITNLGSDLSDGIILIKLIEVLSGRTLRQPNKSTSRILYIENCLIALSFLRNEYHLNLDNIGPPDIVDGNKTLILGLIWMIILHFELSNIIKDDIINGEENNLANKILKNDRTCIHEITQYLLIWCQLKTANYSNIEIKDLSSSWSNGLGFCALIHSFMPSLINYDALEPKNAFYNLKLAFDIAHDQLDIQKLIDPEDIIENTCDERVIITYLAALYVELNRLNCRHVIKSRLQNFTDEIIEFNQKNEVLKREFVEFYNLIESALNSSKPLLKYNLCQINEWLQHFFQSMLMVRSAQQKLAKNSVLAQNKFLDLSISVKSSELESFFKLIKSYIELFDDLSTHNNLQNLRKVADINEFNFATNRIDIVHRSLDRIENMLIDINLPDMENYDKNIDVFKSLDSYLSAYKFIPFEFNSLNNQIESLENELNGSDIPEDSAISSEYSTYTSKLLNHVHELKDKYYNLKNTFDKKFQNFTSIFSYIQSCYKLEYMIESIHKFNFGLPQIMKDLDSLHLAIANGTDHSINYDVLKHLLLMIRTKITFWVSEKNLVDDQINVISPSSCISDKNQHFIQFLSIKLDVAGKLLGEASDMIVAAEKMYETIQSQIIVFETIVLHQNFSEKLHIFLSNYQTSSVHNDFQENISAKKNSLYQKNSFKNLNAFVGLADLFRSIHISLLNASKENLPCNDNADFNLNKIFKSLTYIYNIIENTQINSSKQSKSESYLKMVENLSNCIKKNKNNEISKISLDELNIQYSKLREIFENNEIYFSYFDQCKKCLTDIESIMVDINRKLIVKKTSDNISFVNSIFNASINSLEMLISQIKNCLYFNSRSDNLDDLEIYLNDTKILMNQVGNISNDYETYTSVSQINTATSYSISGIFPLKNEIDSKTSSMQESVNNIQLIVNDEDPNLSMSVNECKSKIDSLNNQISSINDDCTIKKGLLISLSSIHEHSASLKNLDEFFSKIDLQNPSKGSCMVLKKNLDHHDYVMSCLECLSPNSKPSSQSPKIHSLYNKALDEKKNFYKQFNKFNSKVNNLENSIIYQDMIDKNMQYLIHIIDEMLKIATELSLAIDTHSDMTFCNIDQIEEKYNTMIIISTEISNKISTCDFKIIKLSDLREKYIINKEDSIYPSYIKYLNKIGHAALICKNLQIQLNNFEEELKVINSLITVHHELENAENILKTSLYQSSNLLSETFNQHCDDKNEKSTSVICLDIKKLKDIVNELKQQNKTFNTIKIDHKYFVDKFSEKIEEYCENDSQDYTDVSIRTSQSNASQLNRYNSDFETDVNIFKNYIDYYYAKDIVNIDQFFDVREEVLAFKLEDLKSKFERDFSMNDTEQKKIIDKHLQYCTSKLTDISYQSKYQPTPNLSLKDVQLDSKPNVYSHHISLYDRLETFLAFDFSSIINQLADYHDIGIIKSFKSEYIDETESLIMNWLNYKDQNQLNINMIKDLPVNNLITDTQNQIQQLKDMLNENINSIKMDLSKQKSNLFIIKFQDRLSRLLNLNSSIGLFKGSNDLSYTSLMNLICAYDELDDDVRNKLASMNNIATIETLLSSSQTNEHDPKSLTETLAIINDEFQRKFAFVMATPSYHILPNIFSAFEHIKTIFDFVCQMFDSNSLEYSSLNADPLLDQSIFDFYEKNTNNFNDTMKQIQQTKIHHKRLLDCGNKVNTINWLLKIRMDVVNLVDIDTSYDIRNCIIIKCLEKLSNDLSEQKMYILNDPLQSIRSEIENTNLFNFTLSNWLKDCQESWNTFFDIVNQYQVKFESNKLIIDHLCDNYYMLSKINIIDQMIHDNLNSKKKLDILEYPDFRFDIANMTNEVQKCIDNSRNLTKKFDISTTSLGVDLKNTTELMVTNFNEVYDKSLAFNSLVLIESKWITFKTLHRKLKMLIIDLMQSLNGITFDNSDDGQIWSVIMHHKALEEEANSLFGMFNALHNLANNIVFDDPTLFGQVDQLLLSLTNQRADLMQMIENLCAKLRLSIYESIKSHDLQIKQLAKRMTEREIEYLTTLFSDLESRNDLVAIKYALENLTDFAKSSQMHLDNLQCAQESSYDVKHIKFEPQNVRYKYIIDLSKLHKSKKFIKSSNTLQHKFPYLEARKTVNINDKMLSFINEDQGSTTIGKNNIEFSHTNIDQLEGRLFHRIVYLKPNSAKTLVYKKRWENLYCILSFGLMFLYKSPEDIQKLPSQPLYTWDLFDCSISILGSHRGKENVFCVKQNNNEFEIILCAKTADESITWLNMITKQSQFKTTTQFSRISSNGMKEIRKRYVRQSKTI